MSRIESLIDHGAQVNKPDKLGWTALHWAAAAGRVEAAKSLLDRAADPNLHDLFGMTPLHWAAMLGHAEIVEPLLHSGARIDSRNLYGMTPLHESANKEVSKELMRRGAKLETTDKQGKTPLHVARNAEVARVLLEAGANIAVRTANGRTALELMVMNEVEAAGLIFYLETPTIRLRGDRSHFKISVRNVSICEIRNLALVIQSPAAWAIVRPRKLLRLAPGEMKNIAIELRRRSEMSQGEHPIDIHVALGLKGVGKLKLSVDTRKNELPSDRGMIRLGKGVLRPASKPGVKYLPFLAIPLMVIAYWFWRRFRRR